MKSVTRKMTIGGMTIVEADAGIGWGGDSSQGRKDRDRDVSHLTKNIVLKEDATFSRAQGNECTKIEDETRLMTVEDE